MSDPLSPYTLAIGAGAPLSFAAMHVTAATLTLVANGIDSLTFSIDLPLSIAGIVPQVRVRLYRDTTCIFVGEITDSSSSRSTSAPGAKNYIAQSYLHRLQHITFLPKRFVWDAVAGEYTLQPDPRVTLGTYVPQGATKPVRCTNGEQVRDILDYAATRIPPGLIDIGAIAAGYNCPTDTKENISCWDAIISQLRWLPDHVLYCDYSSGTAEVNLIASGNLTATTLNAPDDILDPAPPNRVTTVDLTPRHDLVLPGVIVYFRRLDTVDGATVEIRQLQSAGNTSHFRTLELFVDLEPGSITTVSQNLKTADLPNFGSPAGAEAWLKTKAPWLNDLSDLTVTALTRSGKKNYTREITEGAIHSWMGVNLEQEIVTATIKYSRGQYDSDIVDSATIKVPIPITSTNGRTRTYRANASYTSPEAAPAGLAAGIYASWSVLHYDGSISSTISEIPLLRPGQAVSVASASDAIIQRTTIDLASDAITLDFGTSRALEADSLVALFRAIRYVRWSTSLADDPDPGKDDPDKDSTDPAATTTSAVASPSAGASTPAIARTALGLHDDSKHIVLDTSLVPAGATLKVRDITYPSSSGQVTSKILSTSDISLPIIANAIVDLRVVGPDADGPQRIQIKRGTVIAYNVGPWQSFLTPVAYDV